jgi:lactate dehydrogenase-like 2-hydroxyacid dehydrogenase
MTDKAPALLSMAQQDLPYELLDGLIEVVDPVWAPEGVDKITGSDAEILVTANAELTGATLDRFPRLRTIIATGTAVDYIDLAYCAGRGIIVSNTPGYTGSSVAEHALTLALAANRRIVELDALSRSDSGTEPVLAAELSGKTAGIIGLGDIGGRLARMLQGIGMDVVFVNRSPRNLPGARQVTFAELLAASHFVFLTLPLTEQTRHLIDAAALGSMREGSFLVNISSDELVDVAALASALRSGSLGGAALDVIGSSTPFRGLPNLIMTPCVAWYTAECVFRRAEIWVGTVKAFVEEGARYRVT